MNKYLFVLLGIALFFSSGSLQLWATEGDLPEENGNVFLTNQYLLENIRLVKLAQECYAEGRYDEAIKHAEEAIKYAQLSNDYISLQMMINETNDTITAAQARLDWANKMGAPRGYPEIYGKAELTLAEALDARSNEDWNGSLAAARQVIAILAEIPDAPVFAAQYLVKNWVPMRDCLWNIAAKPEIYGDPTQWRRIYNANRSKLPRPDNPNLIHPGTLLDIPSIGNEVRVGIVED
ncbi:MAG: LysM peptidoglycan-binding domain-containing protein [Treponema sp.]|nr:LysM peptidoglycan-binding domain-containing protein [Treponema sp.]